MADDPTPPSDTRIPTTTFKSWAYMQYPPELVKRSALIFAAARDREGREAGRGVEEPLGCGFVVGGGKTDSTTYLIVCTAAHLLGEAEKQLQPRKVLQYANPFGPEPLTFLRNDLRGGRIYVRLHGDDERAYAAQAVWASVLADADLAYLVVIPAPDFDLDSFRHHFMPIDSTPLRVGDTVVILGAPYFSLRVMETIGEQGILSYNPGWQARVGSIVAIHKGGTRLVRSDCIETTIPAPGGMSGGPVFRARVKDGKIAVAPIAIGILSHDLPADEGGGADTEIPGRSFFIPSLLLHGFEAPPFFRTSPRERLYSRLMRDLNKRADWIVGNYEPDGTLRNIAYLRVSYPIPGIRRLTYTVTDTSRLYCCLTRPATATLADKG